VPEELEVNPTSLNTKAIFEFGSTIRLSLKEINFMLLVIELAEQNEKKEPVKPPM
jgi:hypothetical protein